MSGRRVDAKVVLLGQEGVGKSSLVERCAHRRFRPGPYQNVSHPGTAHRACPSLGPVPIAPPASLPDDRGCLRGQGDVRGGADGDPGDLGKCGGCDILPVPTPASPPPPTG